MKSIALALATMIVVAAPTAAADTLDELGDETRGVVEDPVDELSPEGDDPHVNHPEDLPQSAERASTTSAYEEEIEVEGSGGQASSVSGVAGRAHIPVVLADFGDMPAETGLHTPSAFDAMLFQDGYPHGAGSFRDYFQDQSGGLFDVTGQVSDWLRMPKTYASYTGRSHGYQTSEPNDWTLVRDAAAAADPEMDFCRFDTDNDGTVDVFFLAHAGAGAEEGGSGLWSIQWRLPQPYETRDVCANGQRARVSKFVVVPEEYTTDYYSAPGAPERMVAIGIFVHEFGHVLGLPDLYDTDYSSPGGVGPWDVMASGTWGFRFNRPWRPSPLSAWSLIKLGWAVPHNVSSDMPGASIPSSDAPRSGVFTGIHRVAPQGSASATEYFLLENRQKTGWGADFPGGGLAVWHVDSSRLTSGGNTSDDSRRLVELVQADGLRELSVGSYGVQGDLGDLFPGGLGIRTLTGSTTPSTDLYSGAESDISLEAIGGPGATLPLRIFLSPPPTSPPPALRDVRASAPGNRMTVTWGDGGADGILEQRIFRSTSSQGPFTRIATVPPEVRSYEDATASPEKGTYFYQVRVFNRLESGPSNIASATFPMRPASVAPGEFKVDTGNLVKGSIGSLGERDAKAVVVRSADAGRVYRLRYLFGFVLPEGSTTPEQASVMVATLDATGARVLAYAPRSERWREVGIVEVSSGMAATITIDSPQRYVTRAGKIRLLIKKRTPEAVDHQLDQVIVSVS